MRQDGLRNSINDLLHRPQAHGNPQDGVAEVLDKTSGSSVHAGEFANQRRQTRSMAGLMLAWNLNFELPTATATNPLVENKMLALHLDWRQLNDLMSVVRLQRHEAAVAAGARARLDHMNLRRAQQGGGPAP